MVNTIDDRSSIDSSDNSNNENNSAAQTEASNNSTQDKVNEDTDQLSSIEENAIAGIEGNEKFSIVDGKLIVNEKHRLDRQSNSNSTRPVAERGSLRSGVVLGGTLIVMGLGFWVYKQFQPQSHYPSREILATYESSSVDFSKAPKIDYQAKYALKDQEISIEKQSQPEVTEPQLTKAVESPSQPVTIPHQHQELPPPPPPNNYQQPEMPTPPTAPQESPEVVYHRVSRMGVFGGSVQPVLVAKQPKIIKPAPRSKLNSNFSSTLKKSKRTLKIGTTATGELTSAIAWIGEFKDRHRNYVVKLSSHLKSPSGKIVVPAGAEIIVSVNRTTPSGELGLVAKSIQLAPSVGGSRVTSISTDIFRILAISGNELLIATKKTPNTISSDLFAALLGGAREASELINRPTIRYSSRDYFGSYQYSESDPNIAAGAISGGAEVLSERLAARNQRRMRELEKNPTIYVLEKGTRVQIYVNKPFIF
ncbi:MAG: hypothetical protein QNJ54_36985 [Prochloraceae cyanobacterium]|nr:hypothetical protein [Prochloraceae cyanobacterium]